MSDVRVRLLSSFAGEWSGAVNEIVKRPAAEASRMFAGGLAEPITAAENAAAEVDETELEAKAEELAAAREEIEATAKAEEDDQAAEETQAEEDDPAEEEAEAAEDAPDAPTPRRSRKREKAEKGARETATSEE